MRYQERIYIQNSHVGVRNKDILNVNMSSDICVFEPPLFNVSGASKIDCTGATGTSYVITTETTIPLTFVFTANTDTFTATSATFKYEIYKFTTINDQFIIPPVYVSPLIPYSGFSGSNTTTQNVPISSLGLDGDYLIKGYYQFSNCTDYLNRLGKTIDTLTYRSGSQYGLYEPSLDYYFIAINQAQIPQLLVNSSNTPPSGSLFQQVILPTEIDLDDNPPLAPQTSVIVATGYVGVPIVTLNGLVLAPNFDYTLSGNIVTLSGSLVSDDILTFIYTTSGGNSLAGNNIYVNSPIVSGVTDGEGSNTSYYNTTTGKYEIYTLTTPANGNDIIVMLNGATLANGIDFYQSTSNPKRLILIGDLQLGDIVTIAYFPQTDSINGLITNTPSISWSVTTPPTALNGFFSLQVSTGSTFSSYIYSGSTAYIIGTNVYFDSFIASGAVGTNLYYRVKNEKNYETLCGDILNSTVYSETIPLTITTNSINSY